MFHKGLKKDFWLFHYEEMEHMFLIIKIIFDV